MSIGRPLCQLPNIMWNVTLLVALIPVPTWLHFCCCGSQRMVLLGTSSFPSGPAVLTSQVVLTGIVIPVYGFLKSPGSITEDDISWLYVSVNPAIGFQAP